jgi:hypothetical protein
MLFGDAKASMSEVTAVGGDQQMLALTDERPPAVSAQGGEAP